MMHDAQKDGSMSWYMGKVDPEAEGYDGKAYSQSGGSIDGDQFGGMGHTEWGGFGSPIGSREETHGTGGVTTQTERGYDNRTPIQGPGYSVSQETPIQRGDLATGGEYNVATYGREIELSPVMWKKLGIGALKQGVATFVPMLGTVMSIGGRIYQKVHKDTDPNTQSAMESIMGYDPRYQGKFFRMGKKTWTPGQQVAGVVNQPAGRGT